MMNIRVHYTTVDGLSQGRTFTNLPEAQRWSHHRVGAHPEIGSHYAISGDGVGKITVTGATLADLFPSVAPVAVEVSDSEWEARHEAELEAADFARYEAAHRATIIRRPSYCTCSEMQLDRVGCDCIPF